MRDLIGRSSVRNTIVMMRQVDRQKTVLIVEGDSDSRSFGRFVRPSHCRVFSPGYPGGKAHAVALFEDLKQKRFPGIGALVDADCDRLWAKRRPPADVCWTSATDREVMILRSPAFHSFMDAHGFTGNSDALRQKLLEAAAPIGYIRAENHRQDWGLDFKSVEHSAFVDPTAIACDEGRCCKEVLARNLNSELSEQDLLTAMHDVKALNPALQDVVCGHDVVSILSIVSGPNIGGKLTPGQVSWELDQRFELAHFTATSTFEEFQQWEQRNAPFIINV